jgi:peptidoglycan hydrolase-like protein with peptidoglycan-binding domain/muramidase (phage lysozyme)
MSNPFGELIGSGEGGYNSYNRGTIKAEAGKGRIVPANQAVDFSNMTILELQRYQGLPSGDPERVFAVGRYQFIPSTLREGVRQLQIEGSEKFTPELQDKLFGEYILKYKRPEIYAYITGTSDVTLRDVQKSVCKEWASVEDPDTPGHVYAPYEKSGNKMHTAAAQVAAALDEMRAEYKVQIDKGLSAEEAWRATVAMGPGQFQRITKTHAARHQSTDDVLREGIRSPAVGELQAHLNHLGYTGLQGYPLSVDRDFGRDTRYAVESFQRDRNLHIDGVVGPNTLAALREAAQAVSVTPVMTPLALDTAVSPVSPRPATVPAMNPANAPNQDAFAAIEAQLRELQRQMDTMNHQREQERAKEREQDNARNVPYERAPQAAQPSHAAPAVGAIHNAAGMNQTGAELRGFDPMDPRHERHPLNALYNELKTRIPDASERRLLQFTAACHSHHIGARNLGRIDFNQQDGIITFCPSWPPGPVATIDLKTPSPEPQQSIADIQQYDRQHAQMVAQIQAQVALTNAHGLQGPVLGGPSR